MGGSDSEADNVFVGMFAASQIAMIAVYFLAVDYGPDGYSSTTFQQQANSTFNFKVGSVEGSYSYYTDVAVMIFIGFGFLMTFLKKYAFSALGYTFLISCFVIEMVIVVEGLFEQAEEGFHSKILLTVTSLVRGLFASGAVMISFGAVLGRTSPKQLMIMAFIEVWVYCLNEYIGAVRLKAVDMGGSIFVHAFGAYFGLAVAWALNHDKKGVAENKGRMKEMAAEGNESRYDSDVSAMIGTLFLWILWPSFNGALAPTPDAKMRVIINTVLSLCGSCIAAFIISHWYKQGKFDMVHVQNATLAGGVAVGSSSDLLVGPGGAMLIGTIAGALSVWGYEYLTPVLERTVGLQDTCGVHNLHGMPGLLGAVTGAITCGLAKSSLYGMPYAQMFSEGRTPSNQPGYQLAATGVTLGLALVGGVVAGTVMNYAADVADSPWDDGEYWGVPDDDESDACAAEQINPNAEKVITNW